jgi:hypothetical protein
MSGNIVKLAETSLADIPSMLRKLADDVEAGKYGQVRSTVIVVESGEYIETLGFGQADAVRAAGLLILATRNLGAS